MSEFKIGGKVLCVENHPQGVVKKGAVYVVEAIRDARCKCSALEIDIGAKSARYCDGCEIHGGLGVNLDGIWWISSKRFIPLSELYTELSATTVEELLNEAVEV